jgi:ABC-type bacteriocin/lantibiotic exporter with double-glycine peptidase domain
MRYNELFATYKKVIKLLPSRLRAKAIRHASFLTIVSIADFLGLAILLPLLLSLIGPTDAPFLKGFSLPLNTNETQSTILFLSLVLVFFVAKTVYYLYLQRKQVELVGEVIGDLSVNNIKAYIQMPYEKRLETASSIISETAYFQPFYIGQGVLIPLFIMVQEGVVLLFIFTGLLAFYPVISMALLSVAVVSGLIIKKAIRRYSLNLGELNTIKRKAMFHKLNIGLSAMLELKESHVSAKMEQDIQQKVQEVVKGELHTNLLKNIPFRLNELIAVIGLVFLILYAHLFNPGESFVLLGSLFALALFRSIPAINRIQLNLVQLRLHANHVFSFERTADNMQTNPSVMQHHNGIVFNNEIIVDNVEVKYRDNSQVVLKVKHLSMNKGAITIFTGKSGSGKSSLLRIIAGQMAAHKGQILVDGKQIGPEDMMQWQKLLSYINQKPYILQDNIAENVAFGSGDSVDVLRVEKALRMTGMDDFCGANLYKSVGEEGLKISEGQKQRLMLARAIYKNTPVLLLDEITANLDPENINIVMETLLKLKKEGKTIIAISHNEALFHVANKVVKFENQALFNYEFSST